MPLGWADWLDWEQQGLVDRKEKDEGSPFFSSQRLLQRETGWQIEGDAEVMALFRGKEPCELGFWRGQYTVVEDMTK